MYISEEAADKAERRIAAFTTFGIYNKTLDSVRNAYALDKEG